MAFLLILFAGNVNFFLLKIRNSLKEHFFVQENFSSVKWSLALEESSFDKLSKKSLLKVGNWQNGSSSLRKWDKIYSLGYVSFSLENVTKFFWATSQCFSINVWNRYKSVFLFSIVFLKLFFWANWTEVWHSCWFCLPEM